VKRLEYLYREGRSAAKPQPKRIGTFPAKTQRRKVKKDFRTWRSWRLGARNIRIREFLDAKHLRASRKFSSIVVQSSRRSELSLNLIGSLYSASSAPPR